MKYTVQHNYSSFFMDKKIVLEAGQVVEFKPAVAAWINRDSPGTLIPWVAEVEDMDEPLKRDRMVKAPGRTRK
jgi:hypothetical protein